jgi:tRNA(fMet)-specific endonuclease VapC
MSLWILDTDTASLLLWKNPNVTQKVQAAGADVAISIVTAQELFNGWVVRINSAKTADDLIRWYGKFSALLDLPWSPPVSSADLRVTSPPAPLLRKERGARKIRSPLLSKERVRVR